MDKFFIKIAEGFEENRHIINTTILLLILMLVFFISLMMKKNYTQQKIQASGLDIEKSNQS